MCVRAFNCPEQNPGENELSRIAHRINETRLRIMAMATNNTIGFFSTRTLDAHRDRARVQYSFRGLPCRASSFGRLASPVHYHHRQRRSHSHYTYICIHICTHSSPLCFFDITYVPSIGFICSRRVVAQSAG